MTHLKILLILTTAANTYMSPSTRLSQSLNRLQTFSSTNTCASLFLLNKTLRATSVSSRELLQGEWRWFLTCLILDKPHEWIMNFPSGVEDATREGCGLNKKKRGVTAAVGVLMAITERCALIGWRCHDVLRQLLSSTRSIIFIISSLTVHQQPGQRGFWLVIDFRLGFGEDLCAPHF